MANARTWSDEDQLVSLLRRLPKGDGAYLGRAYRAARVMLQREAIGLNDPRYLARERHLVEAAEAILRMEAGL